MISCFFTGSKVSVLDYLGSNELDKLFAAVESSTDATRVVSYTVSNIWLSNPKKVIAGIPFCFVKIDLG